MFKIDWPTAIGGAVIGYYAKGRMDSVKESFKGIYTGAINSVKESLEKDSQTQGKTTKGGKDDH